MNYLSWAYLYFIPNRLFQFTVTHFLWRNTTFLRWHKVLAYPVAYFLIFQPFTWWFHKNTTVKISVSYPGAWFTIFKAKDEKNKDVLNWLLFYFDLIKSKSFIHMMSSYMCPNGRDNANFSDLSVMSSSPDFYYILSSAMWW